MGGCGMSRSNLRDYSRSPRESASTAFHGLKKMKKQAKRHESRKKAR